MARNRPGNGPYSRLLARGSAAIDGRSRAGRYLAALRRELAQHLGGKDGLSVAERLLVDRIAMVALRLALFDEKAIAGQLTDHDGREISALLNSFRLLLRQVGLRPKPAPQLSVLDRIRAGRPAT